MASAVQLVIRKSSVPYYRRSRGTYRSQEDIGRSRALQHIREGNELSALLGGTDKTVKQYLFNLPANELSRVLKEYSRIHGQVAGDYAKQTLPRWRHGQVIMSGMVAERLYRLLPPRMPISTKFEVAEELWRHVGPSSSKVLRFGANASYAEIIRTAEDYISAVVHGYQIPDSLQRRFDWLASNDVKVKQQLLNHLRSLDKRLVTEASKLQAASMLDHLSSGQATFTQLYTHTVKVGKHQLKLIADKGLEGCELEDDIPSRVVMGSKGLGDYSWILWLLFIGGVVLLIALTD